MLSCGLIGLPMVGKTTLFNLLTGSQAELSRYFSGKTETNTGIADIPDARIDHLSNIFEPEKTTYAQADVTDVVGLVRGASQGQGVGNQFIEDIRKVDAFVHVVHAFNDNDVLHVDDTIDPMRDVETIDLELLCADLGFVEKRIERITSTKKPRPEQKEELVVLEKVAAHLEREQPLAQLGLNEEERLLLQPYTWVTETPMILVVNVDEEQYAANTYPGKEHLEQYAKERNVPLLVLSAQMEAEIAQLDSEDRAGFLEELGIDTPGIVRLGQIMYRLLGLISFFTVGKDEVRAWTIADGLNAKTAAGKIHSDLERGFIRAETVSYADFTQAGSMADAKQRGTLRLEGKEYTVKDGDILNIRFSV